jgi:hypothetical protein
MSEITEKSSPSEKPKSDGSSRGFRTLEDRAEAFRLGAQLAAALEELELKPAESAPKGKEAP